MQSNAGGASVDVTRKVTDSVSGFDGALEGDRRGIDAPSEGDWRT
jgi:hypothetical protein